MTQLAERFIALGWNPHEALDIFLGYLYATVNMTFICVVYPQFTLSIAQPCVICRENWGPFLAGLIAVAFSLSTSKPVYARVLCRHPNVITYTALVHCLTN